MTGPRSPSASLTTSEEAALADLSSERLWEHAVALAEWIKVSGTPGERAAADYLAARLAEYGLTVRTYEVDNLIGRPESAELEVEGPHRESIRAITHSFAPSTNGGIRAELAWIASDTDAAFAAARIAGRIGLVQGRPTASLMLRAARHGAAGMVCIQEDRLHELCVSPVWGTPTTRTAPLVPTVPVVSVLCAAGERLRTAAQAGPVRVRLAATTFLGWVRSPLVVGEIRGAVDPEQFVLLSGHHCSWYVGAMDNGTANATMLEVAGVLARRRETLWRSVRVAFWPGHTQGRYSGSTWYGDTFWEDLHDNCVLHVNADSTGARGTAFYKALSMPETRDFALAAIRDAIGEEAVPERQSRAGDQSFWGLGVPSIFMDLSQVPIEMAARTSSGAIAQRDVAADAAGAHPEGGLPWWWHTDEDTIDKIDPEVLLDDTRVYLLATLRAADAPLLPFRYAPAAAEIRQAVERHQAVAGDRFDFEPARARAQDVETLVLEVDARLSFVRARDLSPLDLAAINRALTAMDRELVLVAFTSAGPFDQDLALPLPPVPLLSLADRLAQVATDSPEFHYVRTELLRNRNQLVHHLRRALSGGEEALALLERAQP